MPRLTQSELDAIEVYVCDGGGLIVLGDTEQDKYGNNADELLARSGCRSTTTPCRTTSTR